MLDDDFSVDFNGASSIGNEHLYTGRRTDPETGLQLNRYRFYHQPLGRWVTRDPIGQIGFAGFLEQWSVRYALSFAEEMQNPAVLPLDIPSQYDDGMNTYLYVQSDPLSARDPLGLESCAEFLKKPQATANRRRGKGPTPDSGQHCWFNCMARKCGGAIGGVISLVGTTLGEILAPSTDWWDDIKQNCRGVAGPANSSPFGPFPYPGEEVVSYGYGDPGTDCDIHCGTL